MCLFIILCIHCVFVKHIYMAFIQLKTTLFIVFNHIATKIYVINSENHIVYLQSIIIQSAEKCTIPQWQILLSPILRVRNELYLFYIYKENPESVLWYVIQHRNRSPEQTRERSARVARKRNNCTLLQGTYTLVLRNHPVEKSLRSRYWL